MSKPLIGLTVAAALGVTAMTLLGARADTPRRMIEVVDGRQADKVAVVVMPDAFRRALRSSPEHRAGQDSWLAINLVVGNPAGVRVEAFPYSSENLKVTLEALVGEQNLTFAAGGGVRLQIRVAANAKNALYISPGVDVYVSPPAVRFLGHYQTVYYVASDVDVSWVHEYSRHLGFELGLKLGGEIELNAPAWTSTSHVAVLPELGVFTGLRF